MTVDREFCKQGLSEKLRGFNGELPLASAHSLPSVWYRDPEIYQHELDQVFARRWLAVARLDQLTQVGEYVQVRIAGERLLVVRSHPSRLSAYHDVCRHKAASLVSHPCGKVSKLRCRYHGWTYDLKGQLIGTPDFRGVQEFDPKEVRLPVVTVDTWGPLVFVHFGEPDVTLKEYLQPLAERYSEMGMERLHFYSSSTYELDCNWKVFVDNYLDGGYHINTVHPELAQVLDYSAYSVTNRDFTSLQYSPMEKGSGHEIGEVRSGASAFYWWVYPNLMINVYEGIMDVNRVIPLSPDKCQVIFDYFFSPEKLHLAEKSIQVAHAVQLEDEGVCREVQEGLQSRSYHTGRFSVKREAGAYYFHQLLARELRAKV